MILYDLIALQPMGNAKSHGGGTFAYYVFKRMIERKISFSAFYDSRNFIDSEIYDLAINNGIRLYDVSQTSFESIVSSLNGVTVFSIQPMRYMCIAKVIGTIHDCRMFEIARDIWALRYDTTLIERFKLVIRFVLRKYFYSRDKNKLYELLSNPNFTPTTITYYTKYRLIYNFPKCDFHLLPVFSTPFTMSSVVCPYINKEKFFLFVSGDRWKKNVLRGVVALDELFSCGYLPGFKVVIAGLNHISKYKYHIRNIQRFECIGYIDNNTLQDLYKRAFAFIFPSLYEGFGIPPLEAMKFGTPIIASSKSAMPEVCGDAVLYIDPFSIDDIKAKVLMLSGEQSIYKNLQEKGYKRYEYMAKKSIEQLDKYLDFVILHSDHKTINN